MSTIRGTSVLFGTPTKREFKKSRFGCQTCKRRKVKVRYITPSLNCIGPSNTLQCDEKRPLCGNCSRRFTGLASCEFDDCADIHSKLRTTKSNITRNSNIECIESPLNNLPPSLGSSGHNRLLELRLLHHYLTFTCGQLPGGDTANGRQLWAIDVPQMAFNCDYVLNALLGLSAQHLWALDSKQKSLAVISRRYLAKAISSHRERLQRAERSNAEYLLATSNLITHHTWVASHSVSSDEPYTLPLQTYYMARSLQSVANDLFPWLSQSNLLWYTKLQFAASMKAQPLITNLDLDELFRRLCSTVLPGDITVYEAACRELGCLYQAIMTELPSDIMQCSVATMLLRLPPRFLTLLQQHEPAALALFARNIVLLKFMDNSWWLHGKNEHSVIDHAIQGICSLMPQPWFWAIEWPLNVMRGVITKNNLF